MTGFYVDLHVHIGQAGGRPVKITASSHLTLQGIVATARSQKGLDLVGLVDAVTTPVRGALADALSAGMLRPLGGGGLVAKDGLVLLLGAEIEVLLRGRPVHFLAFVPGMPELTAMAERMARHVKNPSLSTQRARDLTVSELVAWCEEWGGACLPAHAFTPHRGLYGAMDQLAAEPPFGLGAEVARRLAALELGLSADSTMADRCSELQPFTFLSNSDAHSLSSMGRECNWMGLRTAEWDEVRRCLQRAEGRAVWANYGLDPVLGKYHRTFCPACGVQATDAPPVLCCPSCGQSRVIVGVADRLAQVADQPFPRHPLHRPPYRKQVPLAMLPGVGRVTLSRLVAALGPELIIAHQVPIDAIAAVAGEHVATMVNAMRGGALLLDPGGGGRYGRVVGDGGPSGSVG